MSKDNRYFAFFPDKSPESGPNSEPSSIEGVGKKTKYDFLPKNAGFGGFGNEKLGLRSSGIYSDDDSSVSEEPSSSGPISAAPTPRGGSKEDLSKLMPVYLDITKVVSAPSLPKNLRTLKHTLSRRYDITGYVNDRDLANKTKNETSKPTNKGGYANDSSAAYMNDKKQGSVGVYMERPHQPTNWSDSEDSDSSSEDNAPRFQLNEDYTSTEQQKQCIAQLSTTSADMKLKAETLMGDTKLTPDQKLNKLASLLGDFVSFKYTYDKHINMTLFRNARWIK